MKTYAIALLLVMTGAVFCQTYVSGAISGVWDSTGSPYYVTDSVCVPSGDSLRIGPGVEVIFQGHYKFLVDDNAVLKAIGSIDDSITFTTEDTTIRHAGIMFDYSSEACSLVFCRIEYGNANRGGGVYCFWADILISNCSFANNSAEYGGAIACWVSNSKIENSIIRNNSASIGGGGIYYAYYDTIYSENNKIMHNLAAIGGGIYIQDDSDTVFLINNIIACNHSTAYGGGVYQDGGHLYLINTTLVDNYSDYEAGGIKNSGILVIFNSILASNLSPGRDELSTIGWPATIYFVSSFLDSSLSGILNTRVVYSGVNYFDERPPFSDTLYHLSDSSYCISLGVSSFMDINAPSSDIDGNPRPMGDFYDAGAFEFIGTVINRKPIFTRIPDDTIIGYNDTLLEIVNCFDFDRDSLNITLNGPSDALLIGDTLVSWSLELGDTGIHSISLIVCDSELCDTNEFEVSVINHSPVFTTCPRDRELDRGVGFSASFIAYDNDGDSILYTIYGPSGAYINDSLNVLWEPPIRTTTFTEDFYITACDFELCDTCNFSVTIVNHPPEFDVCPGNRTIYPNHDNLFTFQVNDFESDSLTYELEGPSGLVFVSDSTLSWTPERSDTGLYGIIITACDSEFCDTCLFELRVIDRPPVFTTCPSDTIISKNNVLSVPLAAKDYDENPIYLIFEGPSGAFIEGESLVVWTPGPSDMGEFEFNIYVSDSVFADTCSFTVTVKDGYCGEIYGVWDSTGSPYIVVCDVTVPPGDTLIIEPGVEVLFEGEYSFTVDTGAVLKVMGTAEDSVIFTSLDSTAWFKGLKFYSASPECELNYCRISRSKSSGLRINKTDIKLRNMSIQDNKSDKGSGINCFGADIEITECFIDKNTSASSQAWGGGVYADSCNLEIRDCIISRNSLSATPYTIAQGGGVCFSNSNARIIDCCIDSNIALGGYAPDCSQNGYHGYGGGSYLSNSIVEIDACSFINNRARGAGGSGGCYHAPGGNGGNGLGGSIYCSNSIIKVNNSIYYSNYATGGGGGSGYDWLGNPANGSNGAGYGGGVYATGSSINSINSVFFNNQTSAQGRSLYLYISPPAVLFNSVVWNSSGPKKEIMCVSSTLGVFHSDVACSSVIVYGTSDTIWDSSNFEAEPSFVDPSSGDFRLHSSSPLIDAGAESVYVAFLDTTFYAPDDDIEGNPRPQGDAWDIGAYESPYSIGNRPPYFVFCPNDTIVPSLAALQIQFSVADPDSDHIFHSIEGPEGAIIEDDFVFWTPGLADTGFNDISIIITDSTYYDTCTFTVEVRACGFPLAGAVSGTLYVDYSPYCIFDDIYVPSGATLIIEPGVHLNYWGNYELRIDSTAVLKAIGTSSDSIVFDIYSNPVSLYHDGLEFNNSALGCSLAYVSITNGLTDREGGAITIWSSSVTIENSNIYNNSANKGGGIHCWDSEISLYNNSFLNNIADSSGAGVSIESSNSTIYGNLFLGNRAMYSGGGGIYSKNSNLDIFNNRFERDTTRVGGAMILWLCSARIGFNIIESCVSSYSGTIALSSSKAFIQNNILMNNYAGSTGGGIYCNLSDSVEVVNCVFAKNFTGGGSYGRGGGIFALESNLIVKNSLFFNNLSFWNSYGGALYYRKSPNPVIMNSIFINDSSDYNGDEIYLEYSEDSLAHPCTLSIYNTLIDTSKCEFAEGSYIHFGEGVFFADPEFVDTTLGDYRLHRTSPCLSAGAESVYVEHYYDSVFYAPEYDMLLNRRPNGLAPDLGPYEFYGSNSAPLIANCPFDTALTSWLDTLVYDIDIIDPDDDIIKLSLVDSSLATELIDSVLRIYLPDIADTGEYEIRFVACDPWACDTCAFWVYIPEGIQGIYVLPERYELLAFPNPFNSSVTIFTPTISDIEIYDFLGNLVHSATTAKAGKALFDVFPASHNPGRYIWQPESNLPSGMYLVRARVDSGATVTKRVVYLK